MVSSRDGIFLKNFQKSIQNHKIIQNISPKDMFYSITPFSIMEALGITIPFPEHLFLKSKITLKTYREDFKYLKEKAEEYFESLDFLKIENLIKTANEQSLYTNEESKDLEKILITNPLKSSEFCNYFLKGLVFDFLCKYEFPIEVQKHIFSEFLIPTFFKNDKEISRFSKFRIIKRLWDNSYHGLDKSEILNNELINKLHKSMKLKRNKDFLDCEIIHFSTIGDLVDEYHNPVISFTLDNKETILNRIIVYKSMLNLFINQAVTAEYYDNHKHIINNWKQGMIVFCDKDGNFTESIDISNVKTINELHLK
jgi:hypothetical protein